MSTSMPADASAVWLTVQEKGKPTVKARREEEALLAMSAGLTHVMIREGREGRGCPPCARRKRVSVRRAAFLSKQEARGRL